MCERREGCPETAEEEESFGILRRKAKEVGKNVFEGGEASRRCGRPDPLLGLI